MVTRETRTKRDLFLVEDRSSRWYRFGSGLGFPGSLLYPTLQSVTAAHNLSKQLGCNVFVLGERDYKADEQLIRLNGTITNTLYLSCTLCYGSPRSPPRSFRQSVSIGVRVRRARDRLLRELP